MKVHQAQPSPSPSGKIASQTKSDPIAIRAPPKATRSWIMKSNTRHPFSLHNSAGVIPRKARSCGRNWRPADKNNAKPPENMRLAPVRTSRGRPSPRIVSNRPGSVPEDFDSRVMTRRSLRGADVSAAVGRAGVLTPGTVL
jgi:hypothetical protein